MSSAVDRREPEVAGSALDVATDLLPVHVGDVVGSPWLDDVPVEVVDPGLGPEGRHGSVRISRVLQHIVLVLQQGVYPLGRILVWRVVDIRAEVPLGRFRVNVKLTQNEGGVEVVNDGATPGAGGEDLQILGGSEVVLVTSKEGSVLLCTQ
jgi:hypothetical protein